MTERHVACAGDAAYLPHLATMLHSLLTRGGSTRALHIHVLHPPGRVKARAFRRLERLARAHGAELHRYAVPAKWVAELPTLSRIPSVMWYRVFLPELLPDAARVLYLDADVLVLDDLAPLWSMSLGDAHVGAVTNVMPPYLSDHPAALGLDPRAYFNSGVLLLNLDTLRADGAMDRVLRVGRQARSPPLLLPDQDALNLVLAARRLALSPRWNAMTAVVLHPWGEQTFTPAEIAEARERPAIRHFEGPGPTNKPWEPGYAGPEGPLWAEHARLSA